MLNAQPGLAWSTDYVGIEALVEAEYQRFDLHAEAGSLKTRVNRIGIAVLEHYGERLQGGLHGGYLLLSQNANPAAAGLDLRGEYGGLHVSTKPLLTRHFSIATGLRYRFNQVDDETDGQRLRLRWHSVRARLGGAVKFETLQLSLGIQGHWLETEAQARGQLTYSRRLNLEQYASGYARLDWHLRPGGRVSLFAQGGAIDGFWIELGQRY